jgi:hypothetical protein
VVEVLRATKEARATGQSDEATATAAVEGQAAALARVVERLQGLRGDLWRPQQGPLVEKVRVAPEAS